MRRKKVKKQKDNLTTWKKDRKKNRKKKKETNKQTKITPTFLGLLHMKTLSIFGRATIHTNYSFQALAQSAGAVEYTDCFSAEG